MFQPLYLLPSYSTFSFSYCLNFPMYFFSIHLTFSSSLYSSSIQPRCNPCPATPSFFLHAKLLLHPRLFRRQSISPSIYFAALYPFVIATPLLAFLHSSASLFLGVYGSPFQFCFLIFKKKNFLPSSLHHPSIAAPSLPLHRCHFHVAPSRRFSSVRAMRRRSIPSAPPTCSNNPTS